MAKAIESKGTTVEKAKIEIMEHPKFEGDMKTNIVSSIDMAEIVSSLFAPAFSDYHGCKICINDGRDPIIASRLPMGAIYVDLYFKDNGNKVEGAWKNIKLRGTSDDGERKDLGARFLKVNGSLNNGRAYEVTKETYEALEEFSFVTNGHTRWNEHTQEIVTPMSIYGKDEVVVCITGLSLNKIITKIYGDKTEEGRFEYIANPSTIIPSKANEFIMQVSQLDLAAVRNLQKTLGIYATNAPQFHQYIR